jgi:kanamycin nucleotidyltransferase
MLGYPAATTREEKLEMTNEIKNRLLVHYKESILAVGVYGSIGQGTDDLFQILKCMS